MENENTWEQPLKEENAKENEESIEKEVATCPQQNGSQFGKFKDAESLLSAYNSLQAEFTRKCQKLSQTIKDINDAKSEQPNDDPSENDMQCEEKNNADLDSSCDSQKQIESQNNTSLCSEEEVAFKSPDWNEKVCEFLKNNSLASEYKTEISNEILTNKDLQKNKNCLDLAWARVMEKEFKPVKEIVKDENFIKDQILTNEQIKQKIIEEYIENLSKNKPPKTINSSAGIGSFNIVKTPNNLTEAKNMVAEMFNIKGEL